MLFNLLLSFFPLLGLFAVASAGEVSSPSPALALLPRASISRVDADKLPSSISLPVDLSSVSSIVDPNFDWHMARDNQTDLDFGYMYFPVRAYGKATDASTWTLTGLELRRLAVTGNAFPTYDNFASSVYSFGVFSPSSNVYLLYQRSLYLNLDWSSKFARGNPVYSVANDGGMMAYNNLTAQASGPYYLDFDFGDLLDALEPYFYSLFYQARFNSYGDGYEVGNRVGYQNGYSEGYDLGYDEGFQEGVESLEEGGFAITTLFGSIVNVPINVLNGLAPLAIWNIPVVSIIVTFMFIGLVFWLIRKMI